MRMALALMVGFGLALSLGCHKKEVDDAFNGDIDRICFAEKHAGALDIETSDRSLVVADWLSRNLKTDKAREFLGSLATLPAAKKAELLHAAGREAKLEGCPSADAWDDVVRKAAAGD